MLFALAIFPSIALLIYVYKLDKKEKEPLKFLWKLFFWGMVTILPILLVEIAIDELFITLFGNTSVVYTFCEAFIVAAITEEVGKYIVLKKRTWKSKYFDCMFDGIVYSVFVSLGFATVENVAYIIGDGISTAIVRMFSSVPGHACFAIYMGYYFSKARLDISNGDVENCKKHKKMAILVPIVLHGIYDWLIMLDENIVGEDITIVAVMLWLIFVIVFFIMAFRLVRTASRNDRYIEQHLEGWKCQCGRLSFHNFCADCGRKRPEKA